MSTSIDLSKFTPKLQAIVNWTQESIVRAILSRGFIRKTQVYLTREMDRNLKEGSTLQENQVATMRGGVKWSGWKIRKVQKYGEQVEESTRYYFRKFRRGVGKVSDIKATIDALKAKSRLSDQDKEDLSRLQRLSRTMRGTAKGSMNAKARKKWEADPVARRPFEKVWRVRASGKRYSSDSKLMLDTGRMRMGFILMKTTVFHAGQRSVVQFSPGSNVSYFKRQNQLRPMWVWDNPRDERRIVEFLNTELEAHVTKLERDTA